MIRRLEDGMFSKRRERCKVKSEKNYKIRPQI